MTFRFLAMTMIVSLLAALGCETSGTAQSRKVNLGTEGTVSNVNTEQTPTPPVQTDIRLEAKISRSEDSIVVRYAVTNGSGNDIYILDAYPKVDTQGQSASADLAGYFLCKRGESTAFVLKGIPPLPQFPVAVRVMPIATKIIPAGRVEREFSIPVPLRERNDWYYAPAPIEDYAVRRADRIEFSVQYLRSTVDGFHAEPVHYATEFFTVNGSSTVKQVEALHVEFNFEPLQFFTRKDTFMRL